MKEFFLARLGGDLSVRVNNAESEINNLPWVENPVSMSSDFDTNSVQHFLVTSFGLGDINPLTRMKTFYNKIETMQEYTVTHTQILIYGSHTSQHFLDPKEEFDLVWDCLSPKYREIIQFKNGKLHKLRDITSLKLLIKETLFASKMEFDNVNRTLTPSTSVSSVSFGSINAISNLDSNSTSENKSIGLNSKVDKLQTMMEDVLKKLNLGNGPPRYQQNQSSAYRQNNHYNNNGYANKNTQPNNFKNYSNNNNNNNNRYDKNNPNYLNFKGVRYARVDAIGSEEICVNETDAELSLEHSFDALDDANITSDEGNVDI
jgi:hypothetical protein